MTQPYSVKIAGATVTIQAGTLSADFGLGKRGTASFLVKQPVTSASPSYVPRIFGGAVPLSGGSGTWTHYQQYQQVSIFDQNNTLIFSGYIDLPKEMKPGFASFLTNQMACMDQRWLTDKRLIFSNGPFPDVTLFPSTILYPAVATFAKVYINRPYDVIVQDIFNNILSKEGVTIGAIFTGPLPSPTLYPSTTLYPNGATTNLSSVTFNYPTVTQALDALVKAASANNLAFYWTIDQNKQLWFVPYSYVVNSTVVDGTHIDQVNIIPYVNRANPLFRNTQYVQSATFTASAQSAAQVAAQAALDGTSGIVESAVKDTASASRADGTAEANQLLNVYAIPGTRFVFTTLISGYLPGQQITVTYAPFGFSSTKMLVESVHLDDAQDGFNIWYTITAVIGPFDATWAQFFGKLLAPSGVSAASSISIGI
jgi:hypothetical protein